jgi:hypothetical protein
MRRIQQYQLTPTRRIKMFKAKSNKSSTCCATPYCYGPFVVVDGKFIRSRRKKKMIPAVVPTSWCVFFVVFIRFIYSMFVGSWLLPLATKWRGLWRHPHRPHDERPNLTFNSWNAITFFRTFSHTHDTLSSSIIIHYHISHTQGDAAFATGDFIAVFDPLDGSANIDASLPVGTIFGIYRRPHGIGGDITDTTKTCHEMFQQDGSQLVAAGYCLFSYVQSTSSVYPVAVDCLNTLVWSLFKTVM